MSFSPSRKTRWKHPPVSTPPKNSGKREVQIDAPSRAASRCESSCSSPITRRGPPIEYAWVRPRVAGEDYQTRLFAQVRGLSTSDWTLHEMSPPIVRGPQVRQRWRAPQPLINVGTHAPTQVFGKNTTPDTQSPMCDTPMLESLWRTKPRDSHKTLARLASRAVNSCERVCFVF